MSHFVGIDWADTKHDICIIDTEYQILKEFVITDNPDGYAELQTILQGLDDVQILIESPDGLLVDTLIVQGWDVYFIPPAISNRHRPRRTKSDRGDAFLLARLMRNHDPDVRPVRMQSSQLRELRQVVIAHDKMQVELQRLALQLRNHLKQYYPTVLTIFRKPHQMLTYAFLERFPNPQQAKSLSHFELLHFYLENRYRYKERAQAHLAILRNETPVVMDTGGHQLHTAALVRVMRVIHEELNHLNRELKRLYRQHPDYSWLKTIPGLGKLNGARLLSRLGDNRERFATAKILRATAGTVPITRSSGKSEMTLFRKECSRPLRKSFFDLALKSRLKADWAKAYYDKQRAVHRPARANRALANRWVGIIWKLWQNRECYDEKVHLRNQRGHINQVSSRVTTTVSLAS